MILLRRISRIVIVGAGGTGGYIIPNIARMASDLSRMGYDLDIHIFDPDIVEEKNISRQNFSIFDIGKHKAQVLAERYSSMFEIPITYHNEKFEATGSSLTDRTLVIDSIDNKVGRVNIANMKPKGNFFWLSCGNTKKDGQVSLSFPRQYNVENDKNITKLFPQDYSEEALDEESKILERLSCADNVVVEPQTLAVNFMGANIVTQMVYSLLFSRSIYYDFVMFDTQCNITRTKIGDDPFNFDFNIEEESDTNIVIDNLTSADITIPSLILKNIKDPATMNHYLESYIEDRSCQIYKLESKSNHYVATYKNSDWYQCGSFPNINEETFNKLSLINGFMSHEAFTDIAKDELNILARTDGFKELMMLIETFNNNNRSLQAQFITENNRFRLVQVPVVAPVEEPIANEETIIDPPVDILDELLNDLDSALNFPTSSVDTSIPVLYPNDPDDDGLPF